MIFCFDRCCNRCSITDKVIRSNNTEHEFVRIRSSNQTIQSINLFYFVIFCVCVCAVELCCGVMDSTIMLLCNYGWQILPVGLSGGTRLKDVLNSICNRWKNLSVSRFSISYTLDYGYCTLENEDDFDNMLFLFSSCDRINAKVDE